MFLNETKPPLEEALEHFGVKGMKWGHRKSRTSSYEEDFDLSPSGSRNHTGAKIAVAGVVVAGAVTTALILKKHGSVSMASIGMPKSPFAGRTFRPENVGNPLWTRAPKVGKTFVDAGYGRNDVFNVTTMARGAKIVSAFDSKIWNTPVLALTRGR